MQGLEEEQDPAEMLALPELLMNRAWLSSALPSIYRCSSRWLANNTATACSLHLHPHLHPAIAVNQPANDGDGLCTLHSVCTLSALCPRLASPGSQPLRRALFLAVRYLHLQAALTMQSDAPPSIRRRGSGGLGGCWLWPSTRPTPDQLPRSKHLPLICSPGNGPSSPFHLLCTRYEKECGVRWKPDPGQAIAA